MNTTLHHMELEELDKKAMECEKYLLEQGYERGDERARSAVDGEAGQDYDTWHKRLNEDSNSSNTDGYRTKYLKEDSETPKWETETVCGEGGTGSPSVTAGEGPFDRQVGGDHYKNFKIQPAIFCEANELSFFPSSIVKYACRFKQKGGEEDLKKIIHYAEMAREYYYGEKEND